MKTEISIIFDEETIDAYARYYFERHPKAKNKPIARPIHPSINEWMRMKRMTMNGVKAKWKDFTVWLIETLGYKGLQIEECEITYRTIYKTNRRHDADNATPKFVLDGLVESGFLVDDDVKHVKRLILEGDVDSKHPRTEIHLTNVIFVGKEKTEDKNNEKE